jgi:hypothetical protein
MKPNRLLLSRAAGTIFILTVEFVPTLSDLRENILFLTESYGALQE